MTIEIRTVINYKTILEASHAHFCLKFKNNPRLSRRTKSQILNLRTKFCS